LDIKNTSIITNQHQSIKNSNVTIIVLFYNHDRYVENLLNNIKIANSKVNAKVIIVDDFSSDNTASLVSQWISKNSNLGYKTIKNKSNLGISKSILNALDLVQTKWVKMHAGDDLFTDSGINDFDKISKNISDNTLVMSSVNIINEHNEITGYRKNPSKLHFSNFFKDVNFYTNPLMSFSVLARADLYKEAIESLYIRNIEDWPLLIYAINSNTEFKLIDKPLVNYRIHDKSIMANQRKPLKEITEHQRSYAENIKEILTNNYNIAPTLSSRYGTYIQFLKYKYSEKPFMIGFVLFLKIFNFKYIVFRLILLFERR
jgi:hypothetical protein